MINDIIRSKQEFPSWRHCSHWFPLMTSISAADNCGIESRLAISPWRQPGTRPCSPQLYTAVDAWRQGSECTGVFWGIIWSKGSRNTSLASHCIFLIWATQKESTGTWGSLATFPKWKCVLLLHNQGSYGRFSPTKLPNNRILFL